MPVRTRASTASGASVPSSSLRGLEARNVWLMLSTASRRYFRLVARSLGNGCVMFLHLGCFAPTRLGSRWHAWAGGSSPDERAVACAARSRTGLNLLNPSSLASFDHDEYAP